MVSGAADIKRCRRDTHWQTYVQRKERRPAEDEHEEDQSENFRRLLFVAHLDARADPAAYHHGHRDLVVVLRALILVATSGRLRRTAAVGAAGGRHRVVRLFGLRATQHALVLVRAARVVAHLHVGLSRAIRSCPAPFGLLCVDFLL